MSTPDATLEERLHIKHYDASECSAAIRGEKVPFALGFPVTRLCVLRGIRYHSGLGSELRVIPDHPEFTGTLNARLIIDNVIPDTASPEEFAYCIWHPDVAREETYWELQDRYPQMRYNVARACAVAGYVDLYDEHEILPEVSIAEEARENEQGSYRIYKSIIEQPIRYTVMNDYSRTIRDNPIAGAFLNGDTATRSQLDIKQRHTAPRGYPPSHNESHYFNITEDWDIDDYDSESQDKGPAE
jgi:hypothetical protein